MSKLKAYRTVVGWMPKMQFIANDVVNANDRNPFLMSIWTVASIYGCVCSLALNKYICFAPKTADLAQNFSDRQQKYRLYHLLCLVSVVYRTYASLYRLYSVCVLFGFQQITYFIAQYNTYFPLSFDSRWVNKWAWPWCVNSMSPSIYCSISCHNEWTGCRT